MQKTRLQNDCWYSGIQVFPKNWNTTRASMREHWYLWYRFYDPTFKGEKHKGVKKIIIKSGINDYPDREDRQAAIRTLIDHEVKLIEQLGYNHFTGQYMKAPEPTLYRIEPDTPWTEAIDPVRQYLKLASSTASDLIYTVRAVQKAATRLRFETIPVSQVKRLHIKRTLEQVQAASRNNFNHSYNKHRSHLMILFAQLIEEECCEQNPVASIRKLIVEQKEEVGKNLPLRNAQLLMHIWAPSIRIISGFSGSSSSLAAGSRKWSRSKENTWIQKGRKVVLLFLHRWNCTKNINHIYDTWSGSGTGIL